MDSDSSFSKRMSPTIRCNSELYASIIPCQDRSTNLLSQSWPRHRSSLLWRTGRSGQQLLRCMIVTKLSRRFANVALKILPRTMRQELRHRLCRVCHGWVFWLEVSSCGTWMNERVCVAWVRMSEPILMWWWTFRSTWLAQARGIGLLPFNIEKKEGHSNLMDDVGHGLRLNEWPPIWEESNSGKFQNSRISGNFEKWLNPKHKSTADGSNHNTFSKLTFAWLCSSIRSLTTLICLIPFLIGSTVPCLRSSEAWKICLPRLGLSVVKLALFLARADWRGRSEGRKYCTARRRKCRFWNQRRWQHSGFC